MRSSVKTWLLWSLISVVVFAVAVGIWWYLTQYVHSSDVPGQSVPSSNATIEFAPQSTITPLTLTDAPRGTWSICSFNIKFLGHYKERAHAALARLLEPYDLVVIQELVTPPMDGAFPDGTTYTADPQAREFHDAMTRLGFQAWLSEEDTASGDQIHEHGSATASEWWIAYYRAQRLSPAKDLPHGFLADDRSNNLDYERVPYAFSFRTSGGQMDFVAISVHLKPEAGREARERRQHEMRAITHWIDRQTGRERDYLIMGDMNIQNRAELTGILPSGFVSLNQDCRPTNVSATSAAPYDHVFYRPADTTEIAAHASLRIIKLVEAMRPAWTKPEPYPGDPLNQKVFEQFASDHNPVVFQIHPGMRDDD